MLTLTVDSPGFAAAIIFAAIGAWGLWRRRHRRTRRAATASLVTAVILTAASGATLVNAYFAYLPQLRDVTSVVSDGRTWPDLQRVEATAARRYPDGVTVTLDVPDLGSHFGATQALAYLPPQYFTDAQRRFPVVYLFHGSPGVPADWFRGGQAALAARTLARAGHPVIVVSPRMSKGWLDDPECVDGSGKLGEPVETHLFTDVIPTVDAMLRTQADRAGRTLGGMSAGGYCALNMGLRHRDQVATIIDMSGLTRPTHAGGLRSLFGTSATAQARANSPADYAAALPPGPPVRVWLDVGSADHEVLSAMEPVAATLSARMPTQFRVRAGAHTFGVWTSALDEALPWSQGLPAGRSPDPSHPGPIPSR